MTAEKELRTLRNVAKNIETTNIKTIKNPSILDNHFFPGYFVTGKVSENKGNGKGYICYGVLTNEKIIIIASGIFQNSNEIDILKKVLMSIKDEYISFHFRLGRCSIKETCLPQAGTP